MTTQRPSILIVDDDRCMRDTLRMILGPSYEYANADSVFSAEQRVSERPYDLVLLDLHMPGGTGLQLLPYLRAHAPSTEVIIVTGHGSFSSAKEAIRNQVADYLEKDFSPVELRRSVQRALERRRSVAFLDNLRSELAVRAPELALGLEGVAVREPEHHDLTFYRLLAEVLEQQDLLTAGHSLRVSRDAVLVARRLSLSEARVHDIELTGYLHDIGKSAINKTILNKDGVFTRADRVEVERHPVIGARLIQHIGFPAEVVDGVLHHHERLDGSGYPDGLRGDDVHLTACVIAVVDSFDAMTRSRLYRRIPMTPVHALEILGAEAPARYDASVVRALISLVEDGSIDCRVDPIQEREAFHKQVPVPGAVGDDHLSVPQEELTEMAQDRPIPICFLGPLADIFAHPEDAAREPLQVLRQSGGALSYFPPGAGAPLPLRGSEWDRLANRVDEGALTGLHAIPGTLTVNPGVAFPLAGSEKEGLEAYTDGHSLFVATFGRPEPGGPLRCRIEPGCLKRRVTAVKLQREPLRAAVASEKGPDGATTGVNLSDELLGRVEAWLLERCGEEPLPYVETRQTSNPAVSYARLLEPVLAELETLHPEAAALFGLMRWRGSFDDIGTARVEYAFDKVPGHAPLLESARALEVLALPVFTRKMDALRQVLVDAGLVRLGDILSLRPAVTVSVAMARLQFMLWSFERPYEALALGCLMEASQAGHGHEVTAAQRFVRGKLPTQDAVQALSEVPITELPLANPFVSRLLAPLRRPTPANADLGDCVAWADPHSEEALGAFSELVRCAEAWRSPLLRSFASRAAEDLALLRDGLASPWVRERYAASVAGGCRAGEAFQKAVRATERSVLLIGTLAAPWTMEVETCSWTGVGLESTRRQLPLLEPPMELRSAAFNGELVEAQMSRGPAVERQHEQEYESLTFQGAQVILSVQASQGGTKNRFLDLMVDSGGHHRHVTRGMDELGRLNRPTRLVECPCAGQTPVRVFYVHATSDQGVLL